MGSVKLLKASAGSGKTYQLAYEYVRSVIDEPWQYRHILAVTFTNKATEEMKRRIVAEINDLAQSRTTGYLGKLIDDLRLTPDEIRDRAVAARTRILHDYSHFSVLTIDKFFQRLIRSFIHELGIDLNFNLELQTGTLLSVAADQLIDELSLNESLKKWVAGFVEEKIGENRRWEIKSELTQLGREVFREEYRRSDAASVSKEELAKIVSGASAEASKIINSLRTIAQQALEIIDSNNLWISDFPYGKAGFMNFFMKYAEGVITEPGSRVEAALASDEKWYSKTSPRKADIQSIVPTLRPLLQQLADGYARHHRFLNSVELLRANYRNFALLTDLSQKIEAICASEGILPISETNNILHKLIAGNDTPFIFEKAGNQFNRFMIDEFQDTSAMQWENFIPLLQNAVSQNEGSPVLLVGDIKQSIYRWRGGDWRILAGEIEREFGTLVTLDLNTNYRSLGNIVAFNNNIVERCVTADNERLDTELETAAKSGLIGQNLYRELAGTLHSAYLNHAQKSVKGDGKGYVNITVYGKNDDEGEKAVPPVISRIEEIQARGYRPGDIAILVRAGADGIAVANMLLDHKQANPRSPYSYDVVTQEALLVNSSPVVGFVLACFRLAVSPGQNVQQAIYNKYFGRPLDTVLPENEEAALSQLRLMAPEEAFESLVMRFGLNDSQSDIAYLQAFHEQLLSFSSSSISDIQLFVRWWEENGGAISVNIPQNDSAITISTIHKAKGLQYKVVIIPFCNWGLNPHSRSIVWADGSRAAEGLAAIPVGFGEKLKNSHMAEDYYRELVMSHVDNTNIFYVAVTRAEEELHIMMPTDLKPKEDKINTLVLNSLVADKETVHVGGMDGRISQADSGMVYEFGQKLHHVATGEVEKPKLYSSFGSYAIENRLRLRTGSERYFPDESTPPALSPRNYGILMHRAFESARNNEDINAAIAEMVASAQLSPDEAQSLREKIGQAFSNPLVRSWFDGSWEIVRNESDIIVPGFSATRRPDRVMVSGNRAVIVDYKFGLNRPAYHVRQIRDYGELLYRMGHTDIEGYVWYVSLDDIEKVI